MHEVSQKFGASSQMAPFSRLMLPKKRVHILSPRLFRPISAAPRNVIKSENTNQTGSPCIDCSSRSLAAILGKTNLVLHWRGYEAPFHFFTSTTFIRKKHIVLPKRIFFVKQRELSIKNE